MKKDKVNKVVLAYSGGLDTSVIVPWLKVNYGCEVVTYTADLGQGDEELVGLRYGPARGVPLRVRFPNDASRRHL